MSEGVQRVPVSFFSVPVLVMIIIMLHFACDRGRTPLIFLIQCPRDMILSQSLALNAIPFRREVDGAASTGEVVCHLAAICSVPQSQLSLLNMPQCRCWHQIYQLSLLVGSRCVRIEPHLVML